MTAMAEHYNPVGKAETIDTWRERGRMPAPTAAGHIIDLQIIAIYETTAVNGQPLDLLVEAKKTNNDPVKQFGVIFSSSAPDWSAYPMPLLWREDGKAGVGRWR
jgi:hypothetical protein